jgi:hypothetical protein
LLKKADEPRAGMLKTIPQRLKPRSSKQLSGTDKSEPFQNSGLSDFSSELRSHDLLQSPHWRANEHEQLL